MVASPGMNQARAQHRAPASKQFRHVEELQVLRAADLAASDARQAGPEGNFKVVGARVAARSGPTTGAHAVAIARAGWVLRGTPHQVGSQSWLLVGHEALRRLGARSYGDVDVVPESAWMLANGSHIGLGRLLEPTADAESPAPGARGRLPEEAEAARPPGEEAYTGILQRGGAPGRGGAAHGETPRAPAQEGPGKTTCLFCGAPASTAREKQAHVREAGHEGFYI